MPRLRSTLSAPPAVVVLEGEAGIGKTRLLTELRAQLAGGDRRFLLGRCRPVREPFPLGPVLEALPGLRAELPGAALSPLAGALRPLLPELTGVLPPEPPPLPDPVAERHRVFRAVHELLGSVGPLVLAVEDLHWADWPTLDFLSYLLADLPPKLSLVLTYRAEEVDPAVPALTTRLSPAVPRLQQALGLLDRAQTGELAAAILGADRIPGPVAGQLHARTAGLPRAVEELLALPGVQAALADPGTGRLRRELAQVRVPAGIRDPVLARVSGLTGAARRVLEAAAVWHGPVPVGLLLGTCREPVRQVRPGLAEALAAGLLTEDRDRIGFRHPLAAQAVYQAMPGARQRQLHSRAAAALAAARPVPLPQLAHHLRYAGRLRAWVVAAERAADRAAERGHHDQAVGLLAELLQQAPLDVVQRGRIAVKLGQAAVETLQPGEVRDLLLAVPAEDLAPPVRGELRLWLALLLLQTGGCPRRGRALLVEAISELSGDRPDLRARAMVALGVPTGVPGVPLAEHLRWLHRSLTILPELPDRSQEVLLLGKVAMVLTCVGDPAWRSLTERIRTAAGPAPGRWPELNAGLSVGVAAGYAGHHQPARELLAATLAGAHAAGSGRMAQRVRAGLVLLDYCRGRWEGLRERAERLVEELAGYPDSRVDAEVVAGCLALAHGDLDLAQHRLTEVVDGLERTGGFDRLPLPAGALVRLALARREPERAVAVAERALAGAESTGVWVPAVRVLPAWAQAMAAAGRAEPAGAGLDRVAGRLAGLDAPLARAALRHARGGLAGAATAAGLAGAAAAAGYLLAAAAGYESLACPYEAAQAREAAAVRLLAAGDRRAEPPLRAARNAYRRLGATWDAARVTRLARQHRLPLPAPHRGGRRGYGDDLSPREQQVAHLAATGRTNEEIARDLFLSAKTVDKHIGAAMRKLGLHSRRELAGQLAGGQAGTSAGNNGVLHPIATDRGAIHTGGYDGQQTA